MKEKDKVEIDYKKALFDIQTLRRNIQQLSKEISELIGKGSYLIALVEGFLRIESILNDDFLNKVINQGELYSKIILKNNSTPIEVEIGYKKVSDIKKELGEMFKYKPPEEEPPDISEDKLETFKDKIKEAKKNLNQQASSDTSLFQSNDILRGIRHCNSLEAEISSMENIIKDFEDKKKEIEGIKDSLGKEYQKLLVIKNELQTIYNDDLEKDKDDKKEDITKKINRLSEISEGYPPCRTIISEIGSLYDKLCLTSIPDESIKGFKNIWNRLKFLENAMESVEPWLKEKPKVRM